MKKLLHVSLMGGFLATVDAPVIAVGGDSDCQKGRENTSVSANSLISLPTEMVHKILDNLSIEDISNLRSTCKPLNGIIPKDFPRKKIKNFVEPMLKRDRNVAINTDTYFGLLFALSITRDEWKQEQWEIKALKRIQKIDKRQLEDVNLIDVMEKVIPIWHPSAKKPFKECVGELHDFIHCTVPFFWDERGHTMGIINKFGEIFIQELLDEGSINFTGLMEVCLLNDENLDTLTPSQKELLRKFLRCIPSFTDITHANSEDIDDLKTLNEILPDEFDRLVEKIYKNPKFKTLFPEYERARTS